LQYVDATLRPLDRQRPPPALKRDPLRQMLTRNLIRTPSQVLMCRQTLDRIGWFDETIRGSADWEMWIRAAAAGRVLCDPRVMTLYRQHDPQWSRDRLMLRHGAVRVMEKTATWLPATRPELGAVLRRRHARWLRELARAQLDSALPQERAQAMSTLRQAVAAWPLGIKSYAQMLRAALVRRCPQPDADSV